MGSPEWLAELALGGGPPWLAMRTRALDDELFVRDDDSDRDLGQEDLCVESTDAVLFTIRTRQAPLACVAERPEIARAMAAAIDAWSTDLVEYKGEHGARRARDWLRSL